MNPSLLKKATPGKAHSLPHWHTNTGGTFGSLGRPIGASTSTGPARGYGLVHIIAAAAAAATTLSESKRHRSIQARAHFEVVNDVSTFVLFWKAYLSIKQPLNGTRPNSPASVKPATHYSYCSG